MFKTLLLVLILLAPLSLLAEDDEESAKTPLVKVDVILELEAINESLASTSKSISDISESFRLMAENGELDPEQRQQLTGIMQSLNQILETTSTSVDALPALVHQSHDQLVDQGNEFFKHFKYGFVAFLVALLVIVIVAVTCLYHFVLKPLREILTQSAKEVSDMATALESAAKSLETNNDILRQLVNPDEAKK